ncbi:MAG: hypothetical protein K0A89_05350 [ANME-2 cluster archaeon]|nr:hypothetical protein [ANME-2 cluster archaeon]
MAQRSGLRLVALKCEKCGSLLDADQHDVVYYCNNCDTGYEIINEKDELVPIEVEFAIPENKRGSEIFYYPFWVFDSDIEITSREASGTAGSLGKFIKKNLGMEGEAKPVEKFFVPAFDTSMENVKMLGLEFTQKQPDYDTIKKDKLRGCIYSREDAEKIADFIFLSMEAERADMLKHISYSLGLSSPKIVGIPFYKDERLGLVDGIIGIEVR